MASDSQTITAITTEKALENKVNEEAKLMEKEIVLTETADVVNDKPVSDSNVTVTKVEEVIDQTPAGEPEKESHVVVEEVASVVKADESTEKGKDENSEKVAEQVEIQEPNLVKEVNVDEEKEKDENVETKVDEQVELKEPTLVKEDVEAVSEEKAQVKEKDENGEKKVHEQVEQPILVGTEKQTVDSIVEEDNKDKEEKKIVDVPESTDEVVTRQVEPVDVQTETDVSAETAEDRIKEVELLEVEPKPEASEKVETQPKEVEVVKAEETPETKEEAKVEVEERIVETKGAEINSNGEKTSQSGSALSPEEKVPTTIQDSDTDLKKETEGDVSSPVDVIEKAITEEKRVVEDPSKEEKTTESVSALCPEKVLPTKQDTDTNPEKEAEGDVSSPADVIEKAITEEKHVVEEPSKDDDKENVSDAKDVVTKLATEDENIKKDTETPVAEDTLKEADTETAENKPEESITETAPVVKESEEEAKQEPEITAKEVSVKPKQSSSIMSKVKQSLVKAKKAIIGKSPSSKNISTEESKGEIKVK